MYCLPSTSMVVLMPHARVYILSSSWGGCPSAVWLLTLFFLAGLLNQSFSSSVYIIVFLVGLLGTQGRIQSPILAPDTRNYTGSRGKCLWHFVHTSHAICVGRDRAGATGLWSPRSVALCVLSLGTQPHVVPGSRTPTGVATPTC